MNRPKNPFEMLTPRRQDAKHRLTYGAGWLCIVAIAFVLVACGGTQEPSNPAAEATVSALSTANAQLSTQVAELAAAVNTPALLPAPAVPETAVPETAPPAVSADATAMPATAPVVNAPGDGPLPFLVADIALAPAEQTLYDLRVDHTSNHIFVTDSADQLHVLDATTYAPIKTLPLGGWLELDEANHRLYVYKPTVAEGDAGLIHVLDTTTTEEVGQLTGRAIAIDSANNRLFVGEPYLYSTPAGAAGVRIVDGATLQQTGVFTQPGTPVYNPLRNELLIVAYTVYTADPATQQITRDLFPQLTDLTNGAFLWCNSCVWADGARFYPAEQLVLIDLQSHCAGKGCGIVQPPLFVDATTFQPIDPALAPEVQADCGSQASLAGVVDGKRYHNAMYDRYLVFTNLRVANEQGNPLTLRDGLRIDYVNPRTNQGYLYDNTVIDLATLAPIGQWPAACLLADDPENGLLFGRRGGSLYVIAERGAQPQPPPPPVAEPMATNQAIQSLSVSPAFAVDNTLLAVDGGAINRSTDSGATWMRLRGGLPEDQRTQWSVTFSPDYAADRTIYATGQRGEFWGDGVWRSQDGGDTWTALWDNLMHRRITGLFLAPEFAANHTLVAQAQFFDVASGLAGDSYQQSTDGGLTWSLVVTGNVSSTAGEAPLPPVSEVLPGYAAAPVFTVRLGSNGAVVEYTPDGATWQTAALSLDEQDRIFAVAPAPGYPDNPAIYAFGNMSLWRTTDDGVTWAAWDDPRLAGMDYANQMSAATLSPALAGSGYRLFVGTADGQVWAIDPATVNWKSSVAAAPVAAVVALTATAETAATPAVPAEPTAPAAALTTTVSAEPAAPALALTPTVPTAPVEPAAVAVLPSPTPTTAAAAPASEPLAGEPPAGLFRPEGSFAIMWERTPRIQQDLGWARQAGPSTTGGALQAFERGSMLWREDTGQIYAIFNDGTWQSFTDTFKEGQAESDPKFAPPAGKRQPIRGFGKVWRENTAVYDKLGWALAKEQGQDAQIQLFERGVMLRLGGTVFTLIGVDTDQGKWY